MAFEKEDVILLQQLLDDRYVLQTDCKEVQIDVQQEFAKEKQDIAVTKNDVGGMKKLMWTIAAACIGELVLQFFSVVRSVS